MSKYSILIIDDEEPQLLALRSFLSKRDYNIYTSTSGESAIEIIVNSTIDIVLTDFNMPGWDGQRVLQETKLINPSIEVVVMTAYGTIESAVTMMKNGAFDFITKPIDLDVLETILNKIKEKKYLISENKLLREQLQDRFKFEQIISQSGVMEKALNTAGRVAASKSTVLIRGESGTGKELIAKAIHYSSPRKDKPFITVNVASLSENLMESELFGHEKGAFTGAVKDRIGRFEEADGGTIFIDEVGDIPLSVQVKLLRTIQFGEFQKIGSNQTLKTDVRIIAATHRNLEEMIANGGFREDLFYRLNVVEVALPSLRERKEDIPILIEHFIKKYSGEMQKEIKSISSEALDYLVKYHFPGNVRELENIVERAVVLTRSEYIMKEDLPKFSQLKESERKLDPLNLEDNYEEKVKVFELTAIHEALNRTHGNKSAAARILGITERHLRSRLERLKD
jgi:two-component system NtrC family response regulator